MKKKNEIPLWAKTGHKKPTTRREFLATGLIPFAASFIAPRWMELLLGDPAMAQTMCPTVSAATAMIPFIHVNLAGGAGLAGNFVPMNAARGLLTSYSKLGLGAAATLPIVREFGNVPFAGDVGGRLISQFLQGVRNRATTSIAKTAFVAMPARLRDDSSDNPISVNGYLASAGLLGSSLPSLGSQDSITGVSQKPAGIIPSAPLVVKSFNDVANSLGYAASLGRNLSKAQQGVLARFISKLNTSQTRRVASMSSGAELKTLIDCAGIKNTELLSGAGLNIDPRTNAQVSTIWGIAAGTAANNRNLIFATMVHNALNGTAGAASLQLGGYDYHDNSRTTGDAQDLAAGELVGRILETAEVLQKPVFIYVTSDGAVVSADSDANDSPWTSDRGTAGCSYALYRSNAGRAPTTDFQIGNFTDGQVADDKFFANANPEAGAAAIFLNYMKLNNKLAMFDQLAGKVIDKTNYDKVLKF